MSNDKFDHALFKEDLYLYFSFQQLSNILCRSSYYSLDLKKADFPVSVVELWLNITDFALPLDSLTSSGTIGASSGGWLSPISCKRLTQQYKDIQFVNGWLVSSCNIISYATMAASVNVKWTEYEKDEYNTDLLDSELTQFNSSGKKTITWYCNWKVVNAKL